jgi:hypothetical protein
MSGMDVVTRFDEKFRSILARDFQARGKTLSQQVQQLKARLPVTIVKQLVKIESVCRKVQADPDGTHSQDLADFVTLCLEAEEALENFRQEEIRREEEKRRKEEEARKREQERRLEEKRRQELEEARQRMEEAKEARRQEMLRQERDSYRQRVETSQYQQQQLTELRERDARQEHEARRNRWESAPDPEEARRRQQARLAEMIEGDTAELYHRLLGEDYMARYEFFCQCWHCGHRFEASGRLRRDLACPGCGTPCPALE